VKTPPIKIETSEKMEMTTVMTKGREAKSKNMCTQDCKEYWLENANSIPL